MQKETCDKVKTIRNIYFLYRFFPQLLFHLLTRIPALDKVFTNVFHIFHSPMMILSICWQYIFFQIELVNMYLNFSISFRLQPVKRMTYIDSWNRGTPPHLNFFKAESPPYGLANPNTYSIISVSTAFPEAFNFLVTSGN